MAISVVMPALEMAQETGKLVSWLKKEGDHVSKGEPLLEVETDKAVMEIESPGDGVLTAVTTLPGMEIQVGKTIAWIVQPGELPPTDLSDTVSGRKITTDLAVPAVQVSDKHADSTALRVSPKARRLANELGVDLGKLRGSGPEGEILAEDVARAAESSRVPVPEEPSRSKTASNTIARLMAERTAQSWTSVPHFFVVRDVDASALNAARDQRGLDIEQSHGVKLTITDLLVFFVARTLAVHPRMNASWLDGSVRLNPDIGISIAMAVEGGVVAPVIREADRLDLGAIAAERRSLAERARRGQLRPVDLSGGTFTISNLGMFDVDAFTAIITPPQSAILAVGRIADRVVAVSGASVIRPMVTITLSSDHRVIDGAAAAQFMTDLVSTMKVATTKLSKS
jgi:pyruvate dehydrogenase E2 component (dihydrolipoamide acetyltransferase)